MNHSTSPEWEEGFTWAFDVPPKGQKLHIVCKSKNTFGKVIQFCIYWIITFFAIWPSLNTVFIDSLHLSMGDDHMEFPF